MRGATCVVVVALIACAPDLTLDDAESVTITCGTAADCPAPLLCQVSIATCVSALDEAAPTVVSTQAVSAAQLAISFSEPMSTAGTDVAVTELTITATVWSSDARTLSIFTSDQIPSRDYVVALDGFADRVGNALAPPVSVAVAGFQPVTDEAPPDPIAPADHARIFAADGPVLFGWTARAGATSYTLELSRSPTFDVLVGGPHVVAAPGVSTLLDDLPADATIYWRVTSDTTDGPLVTRDLDMVGDALFVRCGDADDCADASAVQNGTSSRPFRRIQDAVIAALAFSAVHVDAAQPEVRVASRAGGYQEVVEVVGGPLRLLGGYGEDFTTRDVEAERTVVTSIDAALRVTAVTAQPVLIEGFAWRSGGLYRANAAVFKRVATVTVQNTSFQATAIAGGLATALFVTDTVTPGPRFDHVTLDVPSMPSAAQLTTVSILAGCLRGSALTVTAGSAPRSLGVSVSGPSPCDTTLESSVIASSGSDSSTGIFVFDQSISPFGILRLRDVVVTSGVGSSSVALNVGGSAGAFIERTTAYAAVATTYCRGLLAASNGEITVHDSVFVAGGTTATTGSPQAIGGELSNYDAEVIGNTFVSGTSLASTAFNMTYGAAKNVRNNIFATRDASATCVVTDDNTAILSFEANVMLGCTNLYKVGLQAALTSEAGVNALDNTSSCAECEPRRGLGNFASTGTLTTFFVDPNGTTGTLANDFVLLSTAATAGLRSLGKDPTAADCGTYASPESCGGTLLDRAGTTRATPFSIGAYEVP